MDDLGEISPSHHRAEAHACSQDFEDNIGGFFGHLSEARWRHHQLFAPSGHSQHSADASEIVSCPEYNAKGHCQHFGDEWDNLFCQRSGVNGHSAAEFDGIGQIPFQSEEKWGTQHCTDELHEFFVTFPPSRHAFFVIFPPSE